MTKFTRENFDYFGGYLTYGPDRWFVARFKHAADSKPRWVTFMIQNFTVEEWQAAVAAGMSPLSIMEAKGFVQTHILRWRREGKLAPLMEEALAAGAAQSRAAFAKALGVVSLIDWLEANS